LDTRLTAAFELSQNSNLAPTWMLRGELTWPFHMPNVGLARSLSKAVTPPRNVLPEATK
jgi:hypothetical protein